MNTKLGTSRVVCSVALIGLVFGAAAARAQAEVEGNVTIATDYLWRGISQTGEQPALQGGFDWSADNGLYLGVWGSNVDFDGPENLELDYYGGWGTELENGLGFSVGYIYYDYFDGDTFLQEVNAAVSFAGFSLTGNFEIDGLDGSNNYYTADYAYQTEAGIGLYAGAGRYDLNESVGSAYTHYWIGASVDFQSLTFDLSLHGGNNGFKDFGGSTRGLFSISKSL